VLSCFAGKDEKKRTSNVERPTSNFEWKKMKNRTKYPRFGIGFLKTKDIKLRSEATSLFDVQRWMFDVRCSVRSVFDVDLLKQARMALITI